MPNGVELLNMLFGVADVDCCPVCWLAPVFKNDGLACYLGCWFGSLLAPGVVVLLFPNTFMLVAVP